MSTKKRLYEETREAPPGMVWRANGCHELVASEWTMDGPGSAKQAKRDLAEEVAMGVEPCTDQECDWCADTHAALPAQRPR